MTKNRDLVDDVLAVGAMADWLTPAAWLIDRLFIHRDRETVVLLADDIWILDELKHAGIKVYHTELFFDKLMFDVQRRQYQKTVAILRRFGYEESQGE